MTTAPVTFINVFDVDATQQQELVSLLEEALVRVIQHRPGFVAGRLLVAANGTRVVNEVTWASGEAIAATQADPAAADYARRSASLATADPGVYSLHARFEA
jgi:hypothetical protein